MNSLSTQREVKAGVFDAAGRIVSTLILAAVIAGCAAVKPRGADEIVKERSQARWDALLKGDSRSAYAFFSPGSRAVMKAEDYATSIRPGFWKSALVERVTCASPEACEAQVTIEYEFQGRRTKSPLRETWIREGSEWWYVQK